VDWECNVQTLYRERNVGCRVAISSGIDWFFENVDEGIILEDDCLPSKSFFWFCQELLEKYRDNKQVMQINGNYYLDGLMEFKESYYFSKLISCWGWATWKDAWSYFDGKMENYNKLKKGGLLTDYYNDRDISNWMESYLDEAATDLCGIWSTQWAFGVIKQNGISVSPTVNLVQNIGFNDDATTGTHESFRKYTDFKPYEISVINHPLDVLYHQEIDILHFNSIIKITDPRLNMSKSELIKVYIKKILKRVLPMKIIEFLKSRIVI